jgi:hypothetical protein
MIIPTHTHTHTQKHDFGRRDEFLPQRFERRASPEEQRTTITTTTRTTMNEWMDGWTDEGTNHPINEWIMQRNEPSNKWMNH